MKSNLFHQVNGFVEHLCLYVSNKDNIVYSRLNTYEVYHGYKHAMYNFIYI